MDVLDAINLLKTYGLYDKAKSECKRKKIDKAPYDMQGHHEVYCCFLSNKWAELKKERDMVLKNKCSELDNMPERLKPTHDDCSFAIYCYTKEYCEKKCKYYQDKVLPLTRKIDELKEAIEVLNKTAEEDYWLK